MAELSAEACLLRTLIVQPAESSVGFDAAEWMIHTADSIAVDQTVKVRRLATATLPRNMCVFVCDPVYMKEMMDSTGLSEQGRGDCCKRPDKAPVHCQEVTRKVDQQRVPSLQEALLVRYPAGLRS